MSGQVQHFFDDVLICASKSMPDDLVAITNDLVPELQARGLFRREYQSSTLRGLLGLSRPANRFSAGSVTAQGALV